MDENKDLDYLDYAAANMAQARRNLRYGTSDELSINLIAFDVQQGIEKLLKHIIHDIHGESDAENNRRFRVHNINSLITYAEEVSNVKFPIKLKELSAKITTWESGSRYPVGGNKKTVDAIKEVISIYDQMVPQIVKYRELCELREDVEETLAYLPKEYFVIEEPTLDISYLEADEPKQDIKPPEPQDFDNFDDFIKAYKEWSDMDDKLKSSSSQDEFDDDIGDTDISDDGEEF